MADQIDTITERRIETIANDYSTSALRVAIVFPEPYNPAAVSLDLQLLAEGFRNLGHDARVYAVHEDGVHYTSGTELVSSAAHFTDPSYWQRHHLDLAIVVTWLGRANILHAIRTSGAIVVNKADTDGLLGVRVHPWSTLERMVYSQDTRSRRIRTAWFWCKQALGIYSADDRQMRESATAADFIWVESPNAGQELRRSLTRLGIPPSALRVVDVLNPVSETFLNQSIVDKDIDVVAIGRWDAPQKNAALVQKTMLKLLSTRPDARVHIVGANGGRAFSQLAKLHADVQIHGKLDRLQVASLLSRSKVMLFASRWEGGRPNSANEALACGCTIVGPRIPGLNDVFASDFGRGVNRRNATSLARALSDELEAWQAGTRRSSFIATLWRSALASRVIAAQVIESIHRVNHDDRIKLESR